MRQTLGFPKAYVIDLLDPKLEHEFAFDPSSLLVQALALPETIVYTGLDGAIYIGDIY